VITLWNAVAAAAALVGAGVIAWFFLGRWPRE
jgi:hypothetical protein